MSGDPKGRVLCLEKAMKNSILVTLLMLASRVLADAPATAIATIPEDQSTPRGALRILSAGMDEGDGAKFRAVFRIGNPQEQQLVDALVSFHEAIAKFNKAAVDAFGNDQARRLTGDRIAMQAQALADLQVMPESVKDDEATVGPESQPQIRLKRIDGKWYVPVGMLAPNAEPANVQAVIDDNKLRAAIYNEFTSELSTDKYKTAEEAGDALQLKLMKAAMDRAGGAATQPTTRATTPQS
jgi:hypothetical protein